MKRKIRMVAYGLGRMGKLGVRYALAKDVEIVGAFDLYSGFIGKDVGSVVGLEDIGVLVSDGANFKEGIMELKPDIVVATGKSLLRDFFDVFMACAEAGVNAITIAEELFFPWVSAPQLAEQIDTMAKKTGCTITGSGGQELCWGSMVDTMASSVNVIKRITGVTTNDIDLYGRAFADEFGIGLTEEAWKAFAKERELSSEAADELIKNGTFSASYNWNANAWLCDRLGLDITNQSQKMIYTLAEEPVYSDTLGRTIEVGEVCEGAQVVTTETKQGVVIEAQNVATFHPDGKNDYNHWEILSEENTFTLDMPDMPGPELTLATIINRIPDVINAEPGFVSTSRMPTCRYRHAPLNQYVNVPAEE